MQAQPDSRIADTSGEPREIDGRQADAGEMGDAQRGKGERHGWSVIRLDA